MTYGVNGPNGLVPVNSGNGNTWNGQVTLYPITATYASAMFTGDTVSLGTAGTVIQSVASTAILGVLQYVEYQIASNKYTVRFPYWPGNPGVVSGTTPFAAVIDDPRVRFTVQEASTAGASGTPLGVAAYGNNADIVLSTGNTTTGISRAFVSNQTSATTVVGGVKLVQIDTNTISLGVPGTTGTPGGQLAVGTAYQNWIVEINNDIFKAGSTRP
jgi:hypothetical protein